MKKIILIIFAVALLITSCLDEKATRIKSASNDPNRTKRTYVLDTLDNGHILMHELNNHDACCIEYPECPKCKENLKQAVKEVVDSMVKDNDKTIIDKLSDLYKDDNEEEY